MNKQIIEDIVRPYLNKKDEIERISNKYKERKKVIEDRIKNLDRARNNAMDTYINQALSLNFSFNRNDGVVLKNKFDNNYYIEAQELKNELNKLDDEINKEKQALLPSYTSICMSVKEQLIEKQKEIILDLQKKRIDLYDSKEIIKYKNKDKKMTSSERYDLINNKNKLSKDVDELIDCLKLIDKYLIEINRISSISKEENYEKNIINKI